MPVSLPPLYAFRHTNRSMFLIIDCFSYKCSRNMPSPHQRPPGSNDIRLRVFVDIDIFQIIHQCPAHTDTIRFGTGYACL